MITPFRIDVMDFVHFFDRQELAVFAFMAWLSPLFPVTLCLLFGLFSTRRIR